MQLRENRRNRAFVTSIPTKVGDGLGHRLMMTNFDVLLAIYLEVGYIHRFSKYGSLSTTADAYSVDRMYGFIRNLESRNEILEKSCSNITLINDKCGEPNVVCKELIPRSRGGLFDNLVFLPPSISECFAADSFVKREIDECSAKARKFSRKFNRPNTLFQMTPSICNRSFRVSNASLTKNFFRTEYWEERKRLGSVPEEDPVKNRVLTNKNESTLETNSRNSSRYTSISPNSVQISAHIRRGDILVYKGREVIPDSIYIGIICDTILRLRRQSNRRVPITVNIFSEGIAKYIKNNHNMLTMKPIYVNENGTKMARSYWDSAIRERLASSNQTLENLQVDQYIATDTITAIHNMIASDIFIGSRSGLSMFVIRLLGRGIKILPTSKTERNIGTGMRDGDLMYIWGNRKKAVLNFERFDEYIRNFVQKYRLDTIYR